MAELPLGYRFKPTDTELVGFYLTHKIKGQPLPSPNPIMDEDLYSDHPFNILDKTKGVIQDEKGGMEGYFFCRLKKTSPKGNKNINRSIPKHGTWKNKSTPKGVYDDAMRLIGLMRYFKFEPPKEKKNDPVNNKEWKMHEYSVAENDLVLCHITNKVDSSKDDVQICRRLKRSSNYEIGSSSSKHGRSEYESPKCTSNSINNPAQEEVGHQIMDYSSQNQQYYMHHQSIHQQYNIPHQQYTMPHVVLNEVQYVMPQGHGLSDQRNTLSHGHESATNKALGDEHDRMITNDQPQVVQGGGMYCNDNQGATSHNYSLSDCVNDNVQVPLQDYQMHDELLPSGLEELSEEAWGKLMDSIFSDEEKCDTFNDDKSHEETSIEALAEEIEEKEASEEKIKGMLNDAHEVRGEELYDEQVVTPTSEPLLLQVPREVQIYETHQEQAFSMGNNGTQENTSWRFNNSLAEGCNYNANILEFNLEDDDDDFSIWT